MDVELKPIFWHIPKSGGTYVRACLQSALGRDARLTVNSRELPRNAIDRRPGSRWLSSHSVFWPGTFSREEDEFYFTWVRDPVDMVYSSYYYYSAKPQRPHPLFRPLWAREMLAKIKVYPTLQQYITSIINAWELETTPFFPMGYFDWNRHHFDFIGSTGAMDESLKKLGKALGIGELKADAIHVNSSGGKDYTYRRAELERALGHEVSTYLECTERMLT